MYGSQVESIGNTELFPRADQISTHYIGGDPLESAVKKLTGTELAQDDDVLISKIIGGRYTSIDFQLDKPVSQVAPQRDGSIIVSFNTKFNGSPNILTQPTKGAISFLKADIQGDVLTFSYRVAPNVPSGGENLALEQFKLDFNQLKERIAQIVQQAEDNKRQAAERVRELIKVRRQADSNQLSMQQKLQEQLDKEF